MSEPLPEKAKTGIDGKDETGKDMHFVLYGADLQSGYAGFGVTPEAAHEHFKESFINFDGKESSDLSSSNMRYLAFQPSLDTEKLQGVGTLRTCFQNGEVIDYKDVPRELFKEGAAYIRGGGSGGSWLHRFIKGTYRFESIGKE
jgi:hypothetical protein